MEAKIKETNCAHCNVPLELHGTECGWINTKTPIDQNFIITEVRHPGFGQHLNRWKGSYLEDGDSHDISQSTGFQIGYDQATKDSIPLKEHYAELQVIRASLEDQNAALSERVRELEEALNKCNTKLYGSVFREKLEENESHENAIKLADEATAEFESVLSKARKK